MIWYFDRVSRLDALIRRARAHETWLRRESCDTPRGSLARRRYDARLATLGRRIKALCRAARIARRHAAV
jgi:hypothetical protein